MVATRTHWQHWKLAARRHATAMLQASSTRAARHSEARAWKLRKQMLRRTSWKIISTLKVLSPSH